MSSETLSFDIDVEKSLGGRRIAVHFQSGPGLTALIGRSGAGKTSLLNMVAGLLTPDRGHVRVNGETLFDAAAGIDLPPERRRAGYIFQEARLFPHLTVAGNLDYGAHARGGTGWISRDEVLAFLGIGDLLERWPATLSGGEAQRVAIGRALLSSPAFLLMDEPLSSLDEPRKEEILQVIERMRDALKLPILYVTHDPAEVERLATTRIEIDG